MSLSFGSALRRPQSSCRHQICMLASAEAKLFLPQVRALINCAVLYEKDGKLLTAGPGYNPDTKLLVTDGEMPPEINLETAVSQLMELLAEFDFQSQGD